MGEVKIPSEKNDLIANYKNNNNFTSMIFHFKKIKHNSCKQKGDPRKDRYLLSI